MDLAPLTNAYVAPTHGSAGPGQPPAAEEAARENPSGIDGDPQATLRTMEQLRRAALAPPDLSAQDLRVAVRASAIAFEARQQLIRETHRDARLAGYLDTTAPQSGGIDLEA